MLLWRWVCILMTEEAVFCRLDFPLLPLPFITINNNSIVLLMFRQRNQSLKQFSITKSQRWNEQPVVQKMRGTKLLPTIAENREITKLHAKELGVNINRFQHALHHSSQTSQEDMIRHVFYVVRSFGQVDNNFKHIFADLQSKLKGFLFLNDIQICQEYHIREGTSYKKAIKMVEKQNVQIIKGRDVVIGQLEEKVQKLEENYKMELQERHLQICFLREQVEKYKKMSNVEYVISLQNKIKNLKEIISSQEEDYKELVTKNQDISLELSDTKRYLEDQIEKTAWQQSIIKDLRLSKEQLEVYLLKLRDRFDQLKGRLEGMKAIIEAVQQQNQRLTSQRAQLVNRAAVAFQELTPRPKYGQYFNIEPKSALLPTTDITDVLMEQLPAGRQQFCTKYFLAKKNYKLEECEAIREKTVGELENAKSRLQVVMRE